MKHRRKVSDLIVPTLNVEKLLKLALINGGEFSELFFEKTASNQLFYEDDRLDRISSGIDAGVGLRIIYGHQSVYGYTTDLSQRGLETLAQTLSKVVSGKIAYQDTPFAMQESTSPFNYRIQKSPLEQTLKDRLQYLHKANSHARRIGQDLTQVTVGYLESSREIEVVNSFGEYANDIKNYLTFYTELVGTRLGNTQTSYQVEGGFYGLEFFDNHSPEAVVDEANRRLQILLDAKPAPQGTMPVVLASEAGGTMVHEAVGHGLEADLAYNGMSVYQDSLGKQVASPLITVVDDGTMPEKRGSFAFDDEGVASKKNVLIENGILKAYMSDRLSQIKFGCPLTGNGRRESYKKKPIVRMTNTYVDSGQDNPESILANTKKGLYVKSMGGGQVNTITGDFVFAVTEGYLIIDGEIGPAVRGATLTGNGPQVLKSVDKLGSDLGFAMGTCGKDGQGAPVTDAQPTMRIPEMVVGGEVPLSTYYSA